jgi:type II secretory pathway component PulM
MSKGIYMTTASPNRLERIVGDLAMVLERIQALDTKVEKLDADVRAANERTDGFNPRSPQRAIATSGKCNEWEVQRLNSLLEKI